MCWARFDDITSPPRLPLSSPFPPLITPQSPSPSSHTARSPASPLSPQHSGGTSVQHCLLTAWQPQPGSPRPPLGRTRTSPPARTQLHISLSNSGSGSALWRSGPSQPGKSSEKIDSTTRHNTDKHKTQLTTQALQISRTSPIHVSESRKIDIRMEKSKVEHEI